MSKVNAGLLLFYVGLRFWDVSIAGKLSTLGGDYHTGLFFFEMALFLIPALMFLSRSVQRSKSGLFGAALMSIAAGAFYRVDTYLSVYHPGEGYSYFPSYGELIVTIGMAAVGVAVFLFVARVFPVVTLAKGHNLSPNLK